MTSQASGSTRSAPERWNRVFEALAQKDRRRVLLALREATAGEGISLPDHIVDVCAESATKLELSLRHRHLPKLSDYGYVRWTPDPLRAYRGPNFAEIRAVGTTLLDAASEFPGELVYGCPPLERRS